MPSYTPGQQIREGVFFADDEIPRGAPGIKCVACGVGYAGEVDCTAEECNDFGCGRDSPGFECCSAAFVCAACGARNVGSRVAPEMD